MTKAEIAAAQFSNGSACSQSIAMAFAEDVGLDPALAHKLTTGFGGGMGNRQYTCGVITGAVFIISARYGSSGSDESEKEVETVKNTAGFIKAFEKRKGSSTCRKLLGMSLVKASAKNRFETICADCVQVAAEELEKVL